MLGRTTIAGVRTQEGDSIIRLFESMNDVTFVDDWVFGTTNDTKVTLAHRTLSKPGCPWLILYGDKRGEYVDELHVG